MTAQEQIVELENKIGGSLPKEYRRFLVDKIDEELINDTFRIVLNDGWVFTASIIEFFSIQEVANSVSFRAYLFDYTEHFQLTDNDVEPEYLYCIAECLGGATVWLSLAGKHSGKVYYADNGDFGIVYLTINFSAFFENLFSTTNYGCIAEDMYSAIYRDNLVELRDLIEQKQGLNIIQNTSHTEFGLVGLSFCLSRKEILNYLFSIGASQERAEQLKEFTKQELAQWFEKIKPFIPELREK